MKSREKILEDKIHELEDQLANKREALTQFVFRYVTEHYGSEGNKHQKSRETIIECFGEVYANWDDL